MLRSSVLRLLAELKWKLVQRDELSSGRAVLLRYGVELSDAIRLARLVVLLPD
jgi:hypothetical protein